MRKHLKDAYYYGKVMSKLVLEHEGEYTREDYKKIAFYGVKTIIYFPRNDEQTYEQARDRFGLICYIKDILSKLTPGEFLNVFPIKKEYDGERWECKDYFYTVNYLKSLDKDKEIGENIDEILWEYVNTDVRLFNSAIFMAVDTLRKCEGKQSMMTEWAEMNGVKTYSKHTDGNGKEYLLDKDTGKTMRVLKKRPRHLTLLK